MKNKLSQLLKSFSVRVILIIWIILITCSMIWTGIMFVNMRKNAIDTLVKDEKSYIENTLKNVNNIEEVCNMALQIVSELDPVIEYLETVKRGSDLDIQEKIDFYNNDLVALYNITNLNPYLEQIRLYIDAEEITEKKPNIYTKKRMYNFDWAYGREDGKWNIDYPDTVFPESVSNEHLAGITNTLYSSSGKKLGVVEVATSMQSLFPDMYINNDDVWACFVDNKGVFHYETLPEEYCNSLQFINSYVSIAGGENKVFNIAINNFKVIMTTVYIESLDGTYIHITKLDNYLESYYKSQIPYIFVVIISLLVCVIGFSFIATNMFKRFNNMTESITRIKKGETSLRLYTEGDDEISEMAEQINQMLDNLQLLNAENTNRQLIVKNTEIKSMQNQINAHFMYNVLESIKMMAEIEGQYVISDAVTSLGEMFRYSVKWTSGKVALKEEIKYIKNYLSLMNLRIDSEIILNLRIIDEFMDYKIPKMSLQPIVENSVMHGIEEDIDSMNIVIKVFVEEDILYIEVSDTGKGMSKIQLHALKEKLKGEIEVDEANVHGLALKNVQDRIKMYYGDEYGIEVYSREGEYTKVVLLMPFEKREGKNNE